KKACRHGYTQEKHGNREESERIGCADTKKQARHQACYCECACQTCDYTDRRKKDTVSEYQSEHVSSLCAERHTYTDLVCAQCDRVRDHTIDAYRSQHQSKRCKDAEQRHVETPPRDGIGQIFLQKSYIRYWKIF